MRLSQLNVTPVQLSAVFFTHMHSDHTEGFADIMFHRWAWDSRRPKLDIVCSGDVASQFGFTVSCQKFVAHIGDASLQSGEIAQRPVEGGGNVRLVGGPAELANLITFKATEEPQVVWSLGDVKVSAIRSTHIPGHSSYRVDTPAGSVVIGGDATNDVLTQPRAHSTSDQVGERSGCHRAFDDASDHGAGPGQWNAAGGFQSAKQHHGLRSDGAEGECKAPLLDPSGTFNRRIVSGRLQGARWCADCR
jgi:hypothetical protein